MRRALRRRLLDASIFSILGILPFVLWTVYNQSVAATTPGGRELAFHPVGMPHLWQAVYTLTNWLHLPDNIPGIVRVPVLLFVVAGLGVSLWWAYRAKPGNTAVPGLLKLLLLFVILYPLFLAFSISFIDANTPLDERILSPLYVAGAVLVFPKKSALAILRN
jgi:hypothetical protein